MIYVRKRPGMAMCYSAQIWADFHKYQRLGGKLDIKSFMRLAGWTRSKGTWIKVLPKSMRRSVIKGGSSWTKTCFGSLPQLRPKALPASRTKLSSSVRA